MSDPQGLYYEISLTNRQVLVGVLILLLCVTGAFVGGVLVGREAGGDVARAQVGAEGEGGTLDESFRFFEPEGESSAPADSGAADEPSIETPPTTPVEPQEEPSRPVETRTAPPPAPREEPEATGSAAEEEAPEAAAGDVVIQVFSSHDEAQARNILERLRSRDFDAFLSPTEVDGRTMYRVRVGPFEERARAESVAERLKRELRLDTWITRADS